MAKRYESGTKGQVLAYMATCAIRDRVAFLEANSAEPWLEPDGDQEKLLEETRAEIRDFIKLRDAGL